MAKKIRKKTPKELNREYFQSLIATRASLGILGISWSGICLNLLVLVPTWMTGLDLGWNPPYNAATIILLLLFVHMLISQIVVCIEPLRRYFYQHQRFSSVWQFLFVMNLYLILVYMSGAFFIMDVGGIVDIYGSPLTPIYLVSVFLFYVGSVTYNVFWLKRELEKGMPEERTRKNFLAKSSVYSKSSLAVIYVASISATIFLKRHLNILIGSASALLFIGAFSRLHVEYAYAAILKWRDKSYWEVYEPVILTPEQKQSYLRLFVKIAIIIAEIVVFFALGYIGMQVLPQTHPMVPVIRFCVIAILVYWLIRIIRFIWKKIKKSSD